METDAVEGQVNASYEGSSKLLGFLPVNSLQLLVWSNSYDGVLGTRILQTLRYIYKMASSHLSNLEQKVELKSRIALPTIFMSCHNDIYHMPVTI